MLTIALLVLALDNHVVAGYTAIHLESGRRISVRGAEAFPMGSVYKMPIGVSVLKRIDAGTLQAGRKITIQEFSPGWSPLRERAKGKPVTRTVAELLELMVRDSDNTACDVLLELAGGGAAVTRDVGIRGIRVDRPERQIARDIARHGRAHYQRDPRDTATPDAMAAYLVRLFRNEVGLSPESHALMLRLMTETKTGPRRIKSVLPAGATLAHKTGTMPGVVNDVGIVTLPGGRHVAIAVFTKHGPEDERGQEAEIARIAREVMRP